MENTNYPRKTAAEYMADAQRHLDRKRESFERCDTDGFLSQWSDDLHYQLYREKARLVEAGEIDTFEGLYDGDRRVAAKLISVYCKYSYGYRLRWLLRDDEAERYGRKFLPWGKRSRILKQLGLVERDELRKAWCKLHGHGTGLSGAHTVRVQVFPVDDEWGQEAQLVTEEVES